ncbi:hypothetical protein ANCDUO_24923 [Ancylostoma duodenale]|uniref:Uncharacterized protein n=1 Tax=Ancylostoma duodenale TaxID=51022 RepID=A0A0C2BML0_9BILA|nr:hypothetical protein ANCDUO_24923 [Ancylostoma duodenale]
MPKTRTRLTISAGYKCSELSFVDTKLVEELNLPVANESKLLVKIFGSKDIREDSHRVIEVQLLDRDERTHKFRLSDSSVTTSHAKTLSLTKEDLEFIQEKGIQLTSSMKDYQKPPQILLGCDQMWDMVEMAKEELPSGPHL